MKKFKILFGHPFPPFNVFGHGLAKKKKKKLATVVFDVEIDCGNCKEKIEKNITFEKGVKEFEVSLENKTVQVKYRPDKTNEENLRQAIEKLGYKTTVKTEKAS